LPGIPGIFYDSWSFRTARSQATELPPPKVSRHEQASGPQDQAGITIHLCVERLNRFPPPDFSLPG